MCQLHTYTICLWATRRVVRAAECIRGLLAIRLPYINIYTHAYIALWLVAIYWVCGGNTYNCIIEWARGESPTRHVCELASRVSSVSSWVAYTWPTGYSPRLSICAATAERLCAVKWQTSINEGVGGWNAIWRPKSVQNFLLHIWILGTVAEVVVWSVFRCAICMASKKIFFVIDSSLKHSRIPFVSG